MNIKIDIHTYEYKNRYIHMNIKIDIHTYEYKDRFMIHTKRCMYYYIDG